MIVPVILSGGSGSRLWPLSRELFPKQFLSLVNDKTMLQNTVTRLSGVDGLAAPVVVCNEAHRFIVSDQLGGIGHPPSAILLEPIGRNTAPAVAVAALQAMAEGHDPVLLVLPADHVILNETALCSVVETGKWFAREGKLITFGVVPTGPETGYGYIKRGCGVNRLGQVVGAFSVEQFEEKPDLSTAQRYVASDSYYWNSGMFMFLASRFVEELERYAPEIISACRLALASAKRVGTAVHLDQEAFASSPSDSIDYAVMEKTADALVLPLEAGWSDVGSWSALWDVGQRTDERNVLTGDILVKDVSNSYLYAENRMVAAVGVENLIVVETADAVLVCSKDRVQDVKGIVDNLRKNKRDEAVLHRRVYRPWGAYESIDREDRFQVKRITVNPGASLSSQMHHHRAEHWIVVKGTAKITHGNEILILSENQSTYIPLGVVHRLENPGKIPLELIEVQSGSYLGEDDIVRFDDVYGRTTKTEKTEGDCP